ncbi:hypothetical protein ACJX0J_022600, partial [Zea mays]
IINCEYSLYSSFLAHKALLLLSILSLDMGPIFCFCFSILIQDIIQYLYFT